MRIINLQCNDNQSFKYSILLYYLYYYNIKNNHGRISQLNNNLYPYIDIKFNENNDLYQFEQDNKNVNLLIIDNNREPVFLSRNNALIKVIIVKNDNRYAIIKPTLERFSKNFIEINKINIDKYERYKLSDKIKLTTDSGIYQKM